MKHKKLLLVTFFLTLFVFQQAQAGAKILPKDNLPKINSAPQSGLFPKMYIWMYHLNNDGSMAPGRTLCRIADKDNAFGCVEKTEVNGTYFYYPYDSNPMPLAYDADLSIPAQIIDVETDYLPDVLSREMDPHSYPNLEPQRAQAVAARSFADFNFRSQKDEKGEYGYLDNSTEDQAFVPYAFEYYINTEQQDVVRNAVNSTSKYYLAQGGSPIDAQFASDSVDRTATYRDDTNNATKSYLTEVQDPISNSVCDAINHGNSTTPGADYGKVWGMSQRGANRWALGSQCSTGGGYPWSVTWSDYRQILAHYYTGIDILNASGGKVAPDDRWNLLNYTLPSTTATAGTNFTVNVTLQNTSIVNWTDVPVVVGYKWRDTDAWADIPNAPVQTLLKGVSTEPPLSLSLFVPVPPDLTSGTHTLHLDLRRQSAPSDNSQSWFSSAGWPDAQIAVNVLALATATPTVTPTATQINYALRFQPQTVPKAILMASAPNLNVGTNMTIEFWLRTTVTYGGAAWYDSRWILDKDISGSSVPDWAVTVRSGKITSSGNMGVSASAVNNGQWRHIAIARNFDAKQTVIYVDGRQDAVVTAATFINVSNTTPLIVGLESGGPLLHAYIGDLDELRIWNVVRSQSEIQANMSASLNGNEPGLIGYWNFNEGSGQTVADKSITQAHGRLGNSINPDAGDPEWILASAPFFGAPTPAPTANGLTATASPPNFTPLPSTGTFTPLPPTQAPPPTLCKPTCRFINNCPSTGQTAGVKLAIDIKINIWNLNQPKRLVLRIFSVEDFQNHYLNLYSWQITIVGKK